MCGRITCYDSLERIKEEFGLSLKLERLDNFKSSYNIPPSFHIPVIRQIKSSQTLDVAKWGLVPRWSKELSTKYKTFNARAETVDEKRSYREAFEDSRCLVIANGYYEWDRRKQPYYFSSKKGNRFLAFAGLAEIWKNKALTCTIITTEANSKTRLVHHRMPLILKSEDFDLWFNGSREEVTGLLKTVSGNNLKFHAVDKAVGNPRNNNRLLIEEIK